MKKLFFFLPVLGFVTACSTSDQVVSYASGKQPREEYCELDVYAEGLTVSESYKVIGEMSVTDTGFSLNCSADIVIPKIKKAACEAGADAIQLFNVKQPSWDSSTCFQASARFLVTD